jgi:NAD(P)-dependent dehydrogenase (short-subunit alcohol dehydrogenase family)
MRKPVVLITGAGGEIGHSLVTRLAASGSPIITLDVSPLDAALAPLVSREFTGSITDVNLLDRMLAEFEVERVFHLAALLSTRSEFTPVAAHHVNVEGTLNLLELSQHEGESHGRPVIFIYPSSFAAYGLPGLALRSGTVAPSWKPRLEVPLVISTYFSPSAERGRMSTVESTGSGLTVVSSLSVSSALTEPSSAVTGVMSVTAPTRVPPMRTSLPLTRLAALGTRVLSS